MSVPPLVCSTPPPPDQCDDEVDEDEISFSYKDSSLSPSDLPTDHYNVDTFTNFNYPLPERCSPVGVETKSIHIELSQKGTSPDVNFHTENHSNDICDKTPENNNDIKISNEPIVNSEEENNIEDLNLRLESLQLDFQNGKESVEDNLNDTFDDFGTFLGTQILNDLSRDSFYLPKLEKQTDTPIIDASSKITTSEDSSLDSSPTTSKAISSEENDVGYDLNHEIDELHLNLMKKDIEPNAVAEINCEAATDAHESDNVDSFNGFDDSNNILWTADSVCFVDSENITSENNIKSDSVERIDDGSFVEYSETVLFEPEENENFNHFSNAPNYSHCDDMANTQLEIEKNIDDDFDDFATFHSTDVSEEKIEKIDTVIQNEFCDNSFEPDFKAFVEPITNSNTDTSRKVLSDDEEDDFGEFDTYVPANGNVETCNFEAVNFHRFDNLNTENLRTSSETDVIEKLCSAIGNIFTDDTTNDVIESKDEQLELNMNLGESWRHLVNYDAQQSYLFPWNNSASQKTLLKCLGIDSRNILFGPKWNVNMPRFAANLGVSPLQPIRSTQNNDQYQDMKSNVGDMQTAMNNSTKDGDWDSSVEYCGADFQTSSYAESLLLDLEHLMATLDQMTSGQSVHFKISDLFTNACNERDDHVKSDSCVMDGPSNAEKIPHPSLLNIGRKINLPDTHIFTPTDSETPWSHTIHYDDENINDISNPVKISINKKSNAITDKNNVDIGTDDFDDFQSFDNNKSTSFIDIDKSLKHAGPSSINTTDFNDYFMNDTISKPSVSKNTEQVDDFGDFQSAEIELSNRAPNHLPFSECNVLEPVRVTPAAPLVNWPAPGEINASIFDDITDVKNTSLEETPMEFMNIRPASFILKESKIVTENIDDTQGSTIENRIPEPIFNFQNQFQAIQTTKIESKISSAIVDDFSDFHSSDYIHPIITPAQKPSQTYELNLPQTSIPSNTMTYTTTPMYTYEKSPLEPIPAAVRQYTDAPKNTSQQILQPLSLENYSQINWPDPGIDLQDLTRFNPVNSIKSYSEAKDSPSKTSNASTREKIVEDDGWSDFVYNKLPNNQHSNNKPVMPNMLSCNGYNISKSTTNASFEDSEDWSDFVSSSAPPRNVSELKTISQNIHSQKATIYPHKSASSNATQNNAQSNINALPHLSYVSTKSNNNNKNYNGHFQNL